MSHEYNVKFGDIWRMGSHRLLCGDSTEAALVDPFLDGFTSKLCVTDPPYGISYTSRCNSDALYQLKVKNDHIIGWGEAFRLSRAPVLYVWFSFKHYDFVSKAVLHAGYDLKQMVVWIKEHFSLQRHLYHLQHEQCLVCIRDGEMTTELWTGDRKQVSVWKVPSVKPKNRIHPTEKPAGVYTIPIVSHTKEGDCIIDLFAGSASIFEAAERTKRVGLGVELDPAQCGRILERMAKLGCHVALEANLFLNSTGSN